MKSFYYLLFAFVLCSTSAATAQSNRHGQGQSIQMSQNLKNMLEDMARSQVKSFQDNCSLICNKSISRSDRELAIVNAMNLFMDKDRTIQVSGSNGRVRTRTVKSYLRALMYLQYKSITIESADFHLSKKFEPSAEMNKKHPGEYWLEGTVSLIQHFEGRTNEYSYIDNVKRDVKVYIKRESLIINGKSVTSWVCRIGNIQVYHLY